MITIRSASLTVVSALTIVGLETSSPANAAWRIGPTGGAGVGHMSYASEFDKVKFGGGATLELPVRPRWAIRSGVYWLPDGSGVNSAIPETLDAALRANYIAVPIGLAYKPHPRSPMDLYGMIQYAHLVNARWFENTFSGEGDWDVTHDLQRWDAAPVLGVRVITPGAFEVALQHSWGLRSTWKHGGIKNRSLWLLGTFWFEFP